MNRQLLDILGAKNDFIVVGEDLVILYAFVDYMDHNSLWLLSYTKTEDPIFIFTNDAQRYRFTLSEIKQYYKNMKSGIAMDWDTIAFEYISK